MRTRVKSNQRKLANIKINVGESLTGPLVTQNGKMPELTTRFYAQGDSWPFFPDLIANNLGR